MNYTFRCCGLVAAVDASTAPTVVLPHLCNQGVNGQVPIVQVGIADAQGVQLPAQDAVVVNTIAETNVATETLTVEPTQ